VREKMRRLVDVDEVSKYIIIGNGDLRKVPTVEAIPIPHDATNEDVLKAVFPDDAEDIIKYIKTAILNGWLNSKYER
jgi:hypothetical protein